MVDYIQVVIYDFNLSQFIERYKPDQYAKIGTGETKFPIIYEDGPIDFLAYPHKLVIKGSLHVYWNWICGRAKNNHNDFDAAAIGETIRYLQDNYFINWSIGGINNLEFGLNLKVDFDPKFVIDNNILHLNGSTHSRRHTYRGRGMFKEYSKSNLRLRIYYKDDGMRVEVKLKTSNLIRGHGVSTISDLGNADSLRSLYKRLLSLINELLIVDSVEPPERLSESEKTLFHSFNSPQVYKNQRASISREAIRKRKIRYTRLLIGNNLLKCKDEILSKIDSKYTQLVDGFHKVDTCGECQEIDDYVPPKLTDSTKYIHGICQPSDKKYAKRSAMEIPLSDHPEFKKIRNVESNPRNNLKRKILKWWCNRNRQLSLFPDRPIYLSIVEFALLNKWKGTKYDILSIIPYQIKKA